MIFPLKNQGKTFALDLRKIFPRSPQETLGGYVHLPRMIDKARAKLAGRLGEYIWDCPLDKKLLPFLKMAGDDFLKIAAASKSDAEILARIRRRVRHSRATIKAWSDERRGAAPQTPDEKKWFAKRVAELGRTPDELKTFFDLLDADEKRK